MVIEIPERHIIDDSVTDCVITSKPDKLLKYVLFDNEVIQVMGSYPLSLINYNSFIPHDIDLFIRAKTYEEFEKIVSKITFSLSRHKHVQTEVVSKNKVYNIYTYNSYYTGKYIEYGTCFQCVWQGDYTHVQTANRFDMTCCMFRLTVRNGEFRINANNKYIKDLTYLKLCNVYNAHYHRKIKYIEDRGFKINIEYTMNRKDIRWIYQRNEHFKKITSISWTILYCVVKLKILLKRNMHNVYAPGGEFFKKAKRRFDEISNEINTKKQKTI